LTSGFGGGNCCIGGGNIEYLSQKKPENSDEDYMHTGMTRVKVESLQNPFRLVGDYFTDKSSESPSLLLLFPAYYLLELPLKDKL
jgi:hypothetical protein